MRRSKTKNIVQFSLYLSGFCMEDRVVSVSSLNGSIKIDRMKIGRTKISRRKLVHTKIIREGIMVESFVIFENHNKK